jgi:hypothetical protein
MSLIKIDKIEEECHGLGRQVEHAVTRHPQHKLSNKELDAICKPHVESLVNETHETIKRAVEEEFAKKQDLTNKYVHDDQVGSRRENIRDHVNMELFNAKTHKWETDVVDKFWSDINCTESDDDESSTLSTSNPKKRRRVELPIEVTRFSAENNIDDVSSHDLLEHNSESEFWNDCRSTVQIIADEPYDKFFHCGAPKMYDLLLEHTNTNEELLVMLKTLDKLGVNYTQTYQNKNLYKFVKSIVKRKDK